jgi:nitronate monooxygenase
MKLNPLIIGDLVAPVPIIQGGMGVGISLSSLAGAVAKEGGIGVISAAHPGYLEPDFETNTMEANLRALKKHIHRAKEISNNGIIGVNIMRAMRHYKEYVNCCIESGADIIISGAGLPVELPELVKDSSIKFAPIVSSLKAAKVLLQRWDKKNLRMPDFIVIEGPKAGGHLGFSPDSLEEGAPSDYSNYDEEVLAILSYVKTFEEKYNRPFPVVFAGGVYDRKDIDHYLALGCSAVQMGTRFVATEECDASLAYKNAYIQASKEDITIVKSPVGLPGRAVENPFMKLRKTEKEQISKCYQCLEKCNPAVTPYCISGALIRAAKGDTENALLFCGSNAYKVDRITTVKELMDELTKD